MKNVLVLVFLCGAVAMAKPRQETRRLFDLLDLFDDLEDHDPAKQHSCEPICKKFENKRNWLNPDYWRKWNAYVLNGTSTTEAQTKRDDEYVQATRELVKSAKRLFHLVANDTMEMMKGVAIHAKHDPVKAKNKAARYFIDLNRRVLRIIQAFMKDEKKKKQQGPAPSADEQKKSKEEEMKHVFTIILKTVSDCMDDDEFVRKVKTLMHAAKELFMYEAKDYLMTIYDAMQLGKDQARQRIGDTVISSIRRRYLIDEGKREKKHDQPSRDHDDAETDMSDELTEQAQDWLMKLF